MPSAPSRFHSVSGLGCVFLTFDVDLARSRRDRIGAQLLTVWAGVWHGPARHLHSLLPHCVTFRRPLLSSYCNQGFTYFTSLSTAFSLLKLYCLLFAAEPKRMLRLHFFLPGPFFALLIFILSDSPLKCFSIRCYTGLSDHLCSPSSPGDSSRGPLTTPPTGAPPCLPLPPVAIPSVPPLPPGPRSSSVWSHSLILVEHDQQ